MAFQELADLPSTWLFQMALHTRTRFALHAVALASLHVACAAETTEQVTITGRLEPAPAGVAGFGAVPPSKAPFQAVTLSSANLADAGASSLAAITRLDASIADAYNSPGYWSSLTVRGFVLDNNHNVQRDGLPITGETSIALDNKDRIEVLKGISGAQAGVSSPGGLVNFVVKRPRGVDQSIVSVGWSERGNWRAAADIERRLGDGDALGLRLNAAAESLDPVVRHAKGERQLFALAATARPDPDRRLDAEFELSHQSQPSMPGFSMLGDRVPPASGTDPRLNLNNQRWSRPVVFDGTTASLRWTETLSGNWRLVTHAVSQRLRTDDRVAFPFGCSSAGTYDRYCADGTFDLYDYRSDGERRDSLAAGLRLEGRETWAGMLHELSTGVSSSDFRLHANTQAYNFAGVGRIDGGTQLEAPPEATYTADGRHEHSTELHLRDHVELTASTGLWLGLRHTHLEHDADQYFTTPWAALSHQLNKAWLAYASWGEGVETEVAPALRMYTNAGRALPALRSQQAELGLKFNQRDWSAYLTAFDIRRPMPEDVGACDGTDGSCTRRIDGNARHRGIEAGGDLHIGTLGLQASAMWLRARREDASTSTENGLTPTNVAERSARLLASWLPQSVPGLMAQMSLTYEGPRFVLPDNSARIPGWTTVGLAARFTTRAAGQEWLARVGVDNLFNRRAWRESPYQFSHAYLYPMEPRTFRASLQVSL
jgi:iron complex outermembrane recepter protein